MRIVRAALPMPVAALLVTALTGAADPDPPTCDAPAPRTIRADPPVSLSFSISCTDETGAAVSYVVDDPPEHGTLRPNFSSPGSYAYTPETGYEGSDSATFHATSVNGDSAPVEQQILVDPDYNQPPWCRGTAFSVGQGRTVARGIDCFDPDGDELAVAVEDAPVHGTVTPKPFRSFDYTADRDYLGDDAFAFRVDDGHGGTAVAEVVATVIDGNQAPVCRDGFTVARSGKVDVVMVGGSCWDPDGDPVTFELATQPAHGVVSVRPGGGWQIVSERGFIGQDAFTVTGTDGIDKATFTIHVRVVESGETAPECDDLQTTATSGVPKVIQLRCFDRDLDVPRFEIREGPAAGTGTLGAIDQATMTVRFTPDPGFAGTARFVYGSVDSDGASNSAVATVQVNPPGAAIARADATPPNLRVAPPSRQGLRSVLGTGVAMVVHVDEPATLTVRAQLDARSARRLGLAPRARRPVVIGRARRSVAAGRTKLRVKLDRKARRALRKQRRRATTVRLTATAVDGAGNRRELPARVVVR